MKRIILIAVGISAAFVVMLYVFQPDLFTSEGRRARYLRNLVQGNLVVRRNCDSMESYVRNDGWASLGSTGQQKTAQALADYCREQGSTGQMTIFDAGTRRKLAHWDGASLQGF
jgi:hypothetical protein